MGKIHFKSCAEVVCKDKLNCLHQVATVYIKSYKYLKNNHTGAHQASRCSLSMLWGMKSRPSTERWTVYKADSWQSCTNINTKRSLVHIAEQKNSTGVNPKGRILKEPSVRTPAFIWSLDRDTAFLQYPRKLFHTYKDNKITGCPIFLLKKIHSFCVYPLV